MNNEAKDKIHKVYELVSRGVDGEKEAAKAALDRLMKKYKLNDKDLAEIELREYTFKYSTILEVKLLERLIHIFLKGDVAEAYYGSYRIIIKTKYLNYVVLSSSYEYFRKHMKKEYKRVVLPQVNRCRTAKTKKKRRDYLSDLFFKKYVIASKLYEENEVTRLDTSKMTEKELRARMGMSDVKGGNYKTQVTTGLYLEQ